MGQPTGDRFMLSNEEVPMGTRAETARQSQGSVPFPAISTNVEARFTRRVQEGRDNANMTQIVLPCLTF